MWNHDPGSNLKSIWQSQATEPSIMTLEDSAKKTSELRARTRRELLRGLVTPLLVVGISAMGIAWFDGVLLRVVCAAALLWSVIGQCFLNRDGRGKPGVQTGLDAYRNAVERRLRLSEGFFWWSLGPALLATAGFTVPLVSLAARKGILSRTLPFLTLLAIWMVMVAVARIRYVRELQREVDLLEAQTRQS